MNPHKSLVAGAAPVAGAKLVAADYNPVSGITTEYWQHNGSTKVTVRSLQDVEPLLDQNTAELNAKSSKAGVGIAEGLGVKVASIPMGMVERFAQQGTDILTCSAAELKQILNDPDYKKLRTAHGRL